VCVDCSPASQANPSQSKPSQAKPSQSSNSWRRLARSVS
jgi:hypothetical protein